MARTSKPRVVVYVRSGCHLCEEALDHLRAIRDAGHNFDLAEVDIESSDDLHKTYLERIPVVEVDGVEVAELEVRREDLQEALSRAATMAPDDSNG